MSKKVERGGAGAFPASTSSASAPSTPQGPRDQLPRGSGQVGAEQGPGQLPPRSTTRSTPSEAVPIPGPCAWGGPSPAGEWSDKAASRFRGRGTDLPRPPTVLRALRGDRGARALGDHKEAYRITLEGGTSWSRWRSSTSGPAAANGSTWSALSGVHFSDHILTTNDELAGVGAGTGGPRHGTPVYRRGYLNGLIRGGANLDTTRIPAQSRRPAPLPVQAGSRGLRGVRRARSSSPTSTFIRRRLFCGCFGAQREIR